MRCQWELEFEQMNGARRTLSGDLQAHDLVAQFQRQVERRGGPHVAWREPERRLAQPLAALRVRKDEPITRAARGAYHHAFEAAALSERGRGGQRFLSRAGLDHREAAAGDGRQPIGKGAGFAVVVDAIGQPDDAGVALSLERGLERAGCL